MRRYIALNKTFCRSVLTAPAAVYHHTPDIGLFAPANWRVLEYARPDGAKGYAGVFRLAPGNREYPLRLRGVDPSRRYRVKLDNRRHTFDMTGHNLA